MGWTIDWDDVEDRPYEWPFVAIHNRSPHKIAVRSVRFLTGVFIKTVHEGTALAYDDPFDLSFPYLIDPGEIKTLQLDHQAAQKVLSRSSRISRVINFCARQPRLMIECVTTGSTRLRASAEELLPWDERQRWAKH
ncbi:hypothetical protein ACNI3Q_11455 [Sphingomonas sp. FW199]|uniref:hypothetical protein n=1 Tax=Sphingomonas sp. FW199 TaxID=3400217 RepID=UPI003CF7E979